MSLALLATGYSKNVRIGYFHFNRMRLQIARAYSEKHGKLYEKATSLCFSVNFDEIVEEWNKDCDDDLDILLWHSDCDGSFTYQECRKIMKALQKLTVVFEDEVLRNNYEDFCAILTHCAKRRVKLIFC